MIVVKQKPIAEIKEMLQPYQKVLIQGCDTWVKTCFAGEGEVATLGAALRLAFGRDGRPIKTEELTVERQCEDVFIQESVQAVARNEVVLSLACGAGVQAMARRFGKTILLPQD